MCVKMMCYRLGNAMGIEIDHLSRKLRDKVRHIKTGRLKWKTKKEGEHKEKIK